MCVLGGDFFVDLLDFDADLAEELEETHEQIVLLHLALDVGRHRLEHLNHRARYVSICVLKQNV